MIHHVAVCTVILGFLSILLRRCAKKPSKRYTSVVKKVGQGKSQECKVKRLEREMQYQQTCIARELRNQAARARRSRRR